MKLVIDANIIVAAYATDGIIRKQWLFGFDEHEIVISPEIFIEIERSLRQKLFDLNVLEIAGILHDILDRCTLIRTTEEYHGDIADESDRALVDVAITSQADHIITGEHALPGMKSIAGVSVVSLAAFMESVGSLSSA